MTILCEMCGGKINGLRVQWRRGFTAVCCVSCACELARLLREDRIRFGARTARFLIRSRRWDEISERILEDRHELWEKMAAT